MEQKSKKEIIKNLNVKYYNHQETRNEKTVEEKEYEYLKELNKKLILFQPQDKNKEEKGN